MKNLASFIVFTLIGLFSAQTWALDYLDNYYKGHVEGTDTFCGLTYDGNSGQANLMTDKFHYVSFGSSPVRAYGLTQCKDGKLSSNPSEETYRELVSSLQDANCWGLCWSRAKYSGVEVSIKFDANKEPVSYTLTYTDFKRSEGKACRAIKKKSEVKKLVCILN